MLLILRPGPCANVIMPVVRDFGGAPRGLVESGEARICRILRPVVRWLSNGSAGSGCLVICASCRPRRAVSSTGGFGPSETPPASPSHPRKRLCWPICNVPNVAVVALAVQLARASSIQSTVVRYQSCGDVLTNAPSVGTCQAEWGQPQASDAERKSGMTTSAFRVWFYVLRFVMLCNGWYRFY